MKKIQIKNYIYYKLYPLILFHFVSLILIFLFHFHFFFQFSHFISSMSNFNFIIIIIIIIILFFTFQNDVVLMGLTIGIGCQEPCSSISDMSEFAHLQKIHCIHIRVHKKTQILHLKNLLYLFYHTILQLTHIPVFIFLDTTY